MTTTSELKAINATKHGHAGGKGRLPTPTYSAWRNMLTRVDAKSGRDWEYYGARGITVCDRWRKFENFLADMGVKPDWLWLDRKENDKNYEPGNCRWITISEQQKNRRPMSEWKAPSGGPAGPERVARALKGWATQRAKKS